VNLFAIAKGTKENYYKFYSNNISLVHTISIMSSSGKRINSTYPRSAKRLKRFGEMPKSFDLLRLYQSDLGDRILSYASGQDLCTLDILNKQFNTLTTNQWKVVAKERFGMNNGKEGWKVGTSFLRPPVFIHNLADCDEPEPDDGRSPLVLIQVII